MTSSEQGNKLNRSCKREMERAILTLAGIGEALSALHSHRLTHCASLARLGVCPPVWCLGEQLDEFSSPEVVIEAVVAGLAFYLFLVSIRATCWRAASC